MAGIDAAGFALSIVAATDLCFKYGRMLVEICATFKDAEVEIRERVLCVESHWKRTKVQLDFMKRIWESLDSEHQTIQTRIFQVLIGKLSTIISRLQKCCEKRWKYVLTKQYLDDSIEDLVSWQKMFDPSWFLILKVSNPVIDQELSRNEPAVFSFASMYSLRDALREQPLQKVSIFLPKDDLKMAKMLDIPFGSAKYMHRAGSDNWFVVDRIACDPQADIDLMTRDVRELARKLSSVDPLTFGILQCRGVVRVTEPSNGRLSSFDFAFRIPRELSNEPRTLRSYLSSSPNFTLTDRFGLAKQMVKSISYVHTLGFVHKNVRPETVLGFQTKDSGPDLFFLVGFENMRTAYGRTQRLGVCLLEVGLWESFVSYKDSATAPLPASTLGVASDGPEFKQPNLMKQRLMDLAKHDLPKRMGDRYERVVTNCLTCLDQDNADFGDQSEFEDLDGVLVGVRYIEKVH
ncbi:hypothetical protein MMC07_002146 [Pseudocyphellaria aurata]|nr:hypothetical protein [Pseudocyphellaria aurata]